MKSIPSASSRSVPRKGVNSPIPACTIFASAREAIDDRATMTLEKPLPWVVPLHGSGP
jgi:hypothetical protein